MKKIKIINNPSSGRNIVQKRLDSIANILLEKGYTISKYNTEKKDDAMLETINATKEGWDAIIACGGDGTINEVANGIARSSRKIPVAILAAGTVNDFAKHLDIPNTPREFCNMIEKNNIIDVDLGKIDDNYFVNVAAGGMLTSVAHTVAPEAKTILGKAAYYLEGLKDVPKHVNKSSRLNFKSDEFTGELDISLFLITNSSSIGGFKNIAPGADIRDGLFDCLIIGRAEVQELLGIFIELIKGNHINNKNVKYFKTKKIEVSSVTGQSVQIDIDGEYGGELPKSIEVVPSTFKIFIP